MLTSKPDPLYLIFEKHLKESQDGYFDKPTFIETVLKDYLSHLKKNTQSQYLQSLNPLFTKS